MHIILAGGSGFIGQALVKYFRDNAHFTVIGRSTKKIRAIFNSSVQAINWDQFAKNPQLIENADLIINLTGANIGEKRWSNQRKLDIINSRVDTTQLLASACAAQLSSSPPLFNASAVGVYGLQRPENQGLPPALDENTHINFNEANNFLSEVGRKWEKATEPAVNAGVRVVKMRFAVVFDHSGGVLKTLTIPFKLFMGGKIGRGNQPFSWIILEDLLRAIDFLIHQPNIKGPVNFVAPQGITQAELAEALGKALHRPTLLTTPSFAVRLFFGQMGEELLLNGQHVKPSVLLSHGFEFKYPEINTALETILQK